MSLKMSEILSCFTVEQLKDLCRERELRLSGNKRELVARLARSYHGDVAALLDDLDDIDILTVIEKSIDSADIRKFLLGLSSKTTFSSADGHQVSLHSTGQLGDAPQLSIGQLLKDAKRASKATILSAYYSGEILEKLLAGNGIVRFVTNGLGGRRLVEQINELSELERRLSNKVEQSKIRLAFSDGIFHTKLYLFQTKSKAVAWVGSANATSAALHGHNEEILIRVDPAPASLIDYAEYVWAISHSLDNCRPQVNSLPAFFRTGDIYYKPYALLRTTVNPFKPLLERFSPDEKRRLSRFQSAYSEQGAEIGAFNIRLVYETNAQSTFSSIATRSARIQPYAIETCYGYWVPTHFVDRVDEILEEASKEKDQFLEKMGIWLDDSGRNETVQAYSNYLDDARIAMDEVGIDWSQYASKDLFLSTHKVEEFIDLLVSQLCLPNTRAKHSQTYVRARVPELWDDAVARRHFEQTFFESLAAHSARKRKQPAPGWILAQIGIDDERGADGIRDALVESLQNSEWYADMECEQEQEI